MIETLRQLVPPERWISDREFTFTDNRLTFVVDIEANPSMIMQVGGDACHCPYCQGRRERGIFIKGDRDGEEARLARALALVLMAEAEPGRINNMACRL